MQAPNFVKHPPWHTLPEKTKSLLPENGRLEYVGFLLGFFRFSGSFNCWFLGSDIRSFGTSAPNQGLSVRFPPNCSPRKPPRHSPRQARQSQEKYLPCQAAFDVVSGFLFNLLVLFLKLHKKETFALKGFNGKEKLNQCAAYCKDHKSHWRMHESPGFKK